MRSVLASLATLAIAGPSLSNAFLIPAGLNVDTARAGLISTPSSRQDLIHRKVAVECKNCPYYETSVDGIEVWSNKQNSLLLDFSTQPGILNVNGHPLLTTHSPKSFTPLKAVQVPGHAKDIDVNKVDDKTKQHEVTLGFEVFMARIHPGVVNAKLHILSVGFARTNRYMQIVELNLIDDGKGGFLIYDVQSRKPSRIEASVARCRFNVLCRWKTYFAATIARLRHKKPACHNPQRLPPMPAHHNHGGAKQFHTDLLEIFKHHHYQKNAHGHHHHHHDKHHKMSKMCKVFRYILMPLLLTCIVGTLGFTAGLMLYLAYSKLFKKSRAEGHERSDKLDVLEEEGLLTEKERELNDEDLPAYTDSQGETRE